MKEYQNLLGKRYGDLTVIESTGKKKYAGVIQPFWRCKCECGNTIDIAHSYLISGSKKHCGCKRKGNIEGKRFGRLKAIEPVGKNSHKEILWKCVCDCGNEPIVSYQNLTRGKTRSCGCLQAERRYIHGLYGTRIRGIYYKMLNRCNNKNSNDYYKYGERGIYVCEEWSGENGFLNFYNWSMESGYSDELSIDRIDNKKGYSPDNCRWVSMSVQANNKRNNIVIDYKGKKQTMKQWCIELDIPYKTALKKYHRGISIDDIFKAK